MSKRRRRNPPKAVIIGVGALAGAAVLGWYLYQRGAKPAAPKEAFPGQFRSQESSNLLLRLEAQMAALKAQGKPIPADLTQQYNAAVADSMVMK